MSRLFKARHRLRYRLLYRLPRPRCFRCARAPTPSSHHQIPSDLYGQHCVTYQLYQGRGSLCKLGINQCLWAVLGLEDILVLVWNLDGESLKRCDVKGV